MQIEEQEGAAERPTKRKKLLRGAAPTHSMSDTPQRVTMSPQKRPLKRKFDEFVAQMAEFGDNNSLSSTRRDAARLMNVVEKFDSTPQGQLSIITEMRASLERAEKEFDRFNAWKSPPIRCRLRSRKVQLKDRPRGRRSIETRLPHVA